MTNYVISFYPSVLLLFVIASFGAALSVAPFLLSAKNELHQLRETLKIVIPHLGAVFASLILPLWLWFICKKKSWECSGQIVNPQVTGLRPIVETESDNSDSILSDEESPLLGAQHIQKPPSSVPIILFGSGSILYTIFGMVLDSQKKHKLDFATVFFYIADCSYPICLVIQMKFFNMYKGVILKNCAVYHFAIAVMVASQIWLWITSAVKPFFHITSSSMYVDPIDQCMHNSNITNATEMTNQSIRFIYYSLEPFSVEYLTITSGYLFHFWQNMSGKTDVSDITGRNFTSSSPAVNADETLQSSGSENGIHDYMRQPNPKQSPRRSNLRSIRVVLFGIATIVAVLYFVMAILESGEVVECTDKFCYHAFIGTLSVAYFPQVLCFYLIVRIHKTYDPIRETLTTNDIILLFTSSCEYVFITLQFIALIGTSLQTSYIHANGVSVYAKFLYPLMAVIQLSVQTHFLISVSAIHKSGKKLSTPIQAMTCFIGTVSVAQWFLTATQRAAIEKTVTAFCEMYLSFGADTTQLIFLFPFTGFYRFHSAMVAFEVISQAAV